MAVFAPAVAVLELSAVEASRVDSLVTLGEDLPASFLRFRRHVGVAHFFRDERELRANVRDLFVDRFDRQALLHDAGHPVLQEQPVDAAHHYNAVKRHEQNGHWPAEPKSAVQDNERDGKEREPYVGAHPSLHRANAPEHHFFAQTKECSKDKYRKLNAAENQCEGSPADAAMFRHFLHHGGWQTQPGGQTRWIKIPNVEPAGGERREHDKEEPGNVHTVKNSHAP